MKSRKILSLLTIMFALTIFSYMGNVKAYTSHDMQMKTLKSGDVIYFDNSETKWENVYIYIWDEDGSNGDKEYKAWNDATKMTKLGETDIYQFIAPEGITDNKFDHVIFKNGNTGNENQTIDLAFIESGYAFKINGNNSESKKTGYWYLYDKSEIEDYLEIIDQYKNDKKYYTDESYGNLDNLIEELINQVNGEIRLEAKQENGHDNGHYYIEIDSKIEEIEKLVQNLEVNDSLLDDKVNEIEEKLKTDSDKYTEESLQKLQDILDEVKGLLEDDENEFTVDQLKEYLENIDEASNNLEEKIIENDTNTSDKDAANKSEGNITTDTNPKTYDSITLYIVIGIISLGLVGFTVKKYLFR